MTSEEFIKLKADFNAGHSCLVVYKNKLLVVERVEDGGVWASSSKNEDRFYFYSSIELYKPLKDNEQ